MFSEPRLLAKPLVETLYLPRAGASTDAFFDIETGPDFKLLEARITVLYENRILQTSLLRAGIHIGTVRNVGPFKEPWRVTETSDIKCKDLSSLMEVGLDTIQT